MNDYQEKSEKPVRCKVEMHLYNQRVAAHALLSRRGRERAEMACVYIYITVAVIKHHDQHLLWEELGYLAYSSI